MTQENFGDRIREAAELIGGQLELSRRTGISATSINNYVLGTADPSRTRLVSIAKAAGVSAGWLATGEGPMRLGEVEESPQPCPVCEGKESRQEPQPCTLDENGLVSIPRWQNPDPELFDYIPMAEAKLSAGGGCFVLSENMEDYYAFRKAWLSRVATSAKNLVLMRIHGNSMAPTLEDNDTAMIDTGRRDIKDGMIYALRVDHSIMIKRLSFRVGGKVLIISDNRTEYEPYEAQMKDVNVIGQVIYFCRTLVSE